MKPSSELISELVAVDQRLSAAWLEERLSARRRIAKMAVEFQLSPATVAKDIEAAARSAAPASAVLRQPKIDLPLRQEGAARYLGTKYRNAVKGEGWTGRGPRPGWLRTALAAGAALEDFLIRSDDNTTVSDPLRAFQDAAHRTRLTR